MKTTQKKISKDALDDLKTKLIGDSNGENTEPVCFIGYGQSGSGKTSSLINLRVGNKNTPGILMHVLKGISEKAKYLKITANNIYINHNRKDQNSVEEIKSTHLEGERPDNEQDYKVDKIDGVIESIFYTANTNVKKQPSVMLESQNWYIYKTNDSSTQPNEGLTNEDLGEKIIEMFDKREINPTPNNADSSRSHVIITIKMYNEIPDSYKSGTSIPSSKNLMPFNKIAVCDFAGVENKFPCDELKYIMQFEQKVRESNKYGEKTDITKRNAYELVDEACCFKRWYNGTSS